MYFVFECYLDWLLVHNFIMKTPALIIIFFVGDKPDQDRVAPAGNGRRNFMTAEDGKDRISGAVTIEDIDLVDLRFGVELFEFKSDLFACRSGKLPFAVVAAGVGSSAAAVFQDAVSACVDIDGAAAVQGA